MVVPPQGAGGGAPIDAGALEDSYIARFKALDPRVAKMFEYAEVLVGAGVLSVDDVAKYVNDVLPASLVAWHYEKGTFSDNFIASQLSSTNMIASKVAQILSDNNISFSRVAQILNNDNMLVSKAASILNDTNMSISKATQILSDNNMLASRVAQILSDANITADRVQSILYSMADQGFYDKLLDIITVNAPDASYTSNTSLSSGVNRYRNLSIASGVTLTLGASPGVIVTYSVTNNGTIASGWIEGAGGSGLSVLYGGGKGGDGSGAVIILASNINIGTVTSNGGTGANGSPPSRIFAGSAGNAGAFWLIQGDSAPSGGDGSYYGGAGDINGGGGGGTINGYGGKGGAATTTIFANANSLLDQLFKPICDWWLTSVINKTPSSTVSIPSLGGSGGGSGGCDSSNGRSGGGGGGGGGQIIIYGTSVTAGSVQAKGGNGGTGYNGGGNGGGGGGGMVYVFYKSLNGTFTYDVGGGTGANAGGTGVFRAISV
jgi:hypothetical protein